MRTLNLNKWGNNHSISFCTDNYTENGNLYIGMITTENGYPENWSNLTVNLSVKCKLNCAYIDINNNGDSIVEWLITNRLGHLTGNIRNSGWCVYPEVEFDMDELNKYCGGKIND